MIESIVANGHGRLSNPQFMAIHSTANPGASAANHVKYWKNNPTYAVHAVSDWEEAYHTVPFDRLCYQVGNGNYTCIGIEICEATNETDFMRGMEVARDAIWEMLDMMGWGVDRLRSHDWFRINYGGTDHVDPNPYLRKFGKNWEWFVDFVSQRSKRGEERAVQTYTPNNTDAQKWTRVEYGDGWIGLKNKATGKMLDVAWGVNTAGTPVQVYPENGTDSQKWKLQQLEGLYAPTNVAPFELVPKLNEGMRLDVSGGSMEACVGLQIWNANGSAAQQWYIMDDGNGWWTILNNNGIHMALDVVNGGV